MSKEWILNHAANRFQLNFKRNVGATSESIRNCAPKSLKEWEDYYFENVKTREHIEELGKKLYCKISHVLTCEIEHITLEDCIEYIQNLVINRTYDGYITEITTIYGQLEKIIGIKPEPAPDNWDRLYNVDFFIKIKEQFIGIQIKPVSEGIQQSQIFRERNIQEKTHQKFTKKYGGKVFYIFSKSIDKKKVIMNPEVIDEIREEIQRLNG